MVVLVDLYLTLAAIWFNELSSIKRWSGRQAINRKKKKWWKLRSYFYGNSISVIQSFWVISPGVYVSSWMGTKGRVKMH